MKQIHLEILHEGEHWIPCVYMTRVVESIAPDYAESLVWEKVITKERKGALRFVELSKKRGRPAPVPSIYVNGELVFEATPRQAELKEYLDGLLAE